MRASAETLRRCLGGPAPEPSREGGEGPPGAGGGGEDGAGLKTWPAAAGTAALISAICRATLRLAARTEVALVFAGILGTPLLRTLTSAPCMPGWQRGAGEERGHAPRGPVTRTRRPLTSILMPSGTSSSCCAMSCLTMAPRCGGCSAAAGPEEGRLAATSDEEAAAGFVHTLPRYRATAFRACAHIIRCCV